MKYSVAVQKQRVWNATAMLSCAVGISFYFFLSSEFGVRYLDSYYGLNNSLSLSLVPIAMILVGVFLFLVNYLRDGQIVSGAGENSLMKEELSLLRKEVRLSERNKENSQKFEEKLNRLEEKLNGFKFDDLLLDENEKEKIVERIQHNVAMDAGDSLLKNVEEKFSQNFIEAQQLKILRTQFDLVRERLIDEINSLSRRGAVNLSIGVITTIVAVGILASTVVSATNELTGEALASYYFPRITLSVFIEIFSFFFLKLYKSGLGEIKYFQNELTNAEFRFIAVERSIVLGDKESNKFIIEELSKTERNFKLSKGESTVELEKDKGERDSLNSVLSALTKIIPAKK